MEQKREPMDKNWIRGRRCRANGQVTVKPIFTKGIGCKSGGYTLKAVELTSGDLLFVAKARLRMERSILTGQEKSAKDVVVPQGMKVRTVLHREGNGRGE